MMPKELLLSGVRFVHTRIKPGFFAHPKFAHSLTDLILLDV